MSSDSEESLVATSNPPTASAVKSKNSKGTRKPPAKRKPAEKAVRGTVAEQLKKDPREVRESIIRVSERKKMAREVFLTQTASAVDIMQEAFRGIREGVGKWQESVHFIQMCTDILTPIKEFHCALGGKARRQPAKAPPQKKPPVPGRVDAFAATKVVFVEEKTLVPVADESKSESSSDEESEDDEDKSSEEEEEEEDDDEEECDLAGCTRPAKDGASSAAPLRVEDDDGAPPAAHFQPRATARVDVDTPPPFKRFASAAANLAGQAAVAAVGLTLQGAAAASGLALHSAVAASGLALHGAAAGGNMVVRQVAAAMTAPQPQAPAPGQDQDQGRKRKGTLAERFRALND